MRTTIRLDEALLRDAKRFAHETGRTLTGVIEDSLRESLSRRRSAPKKAPVRLPTFKGTGLRPGVDLDDTSDLLDKMDGR